MCASSPTDQSLAYKAGKRVGKTIRQIPKTSKQMEDVLTTAAKNVPGADYIIMLAGFIAGTKGYTPLTMLIKVFGIAGGMETGWPGLNPNSTWGRTVAKIEAQQSGTPPTPENTLSAEEILTLGCVGLIEAYALTRPGTVGAIGSTIAGVIQGIGSIIPG